MNAAETNEDPANPNWDIWNQIRTVPSPPVLAPFPARKGPTTVGKRGYTGETFADWLAEPRNSQLRQMRLMTC
jgi:hypothetical protein